MPVDVKDIVKKAEISQSMVLWARQHHPVIAHETVERTRCLTRELRHAKKFFSSLKTLHIVRISAYREIQGGLENIAPSLFIGDSILRSVHVNKLGIRMPEVFIRHLIHKMLLHSLSYDDVDASSVEMAFT